MKTVFRNILCILLVCTVAFSGTAAVTGYCVSGEAVSRSETLPVSRSSDAPPESYSKIQKTGYNILQKIIDSALKAIIGIFPDIGWENIEDYEQDNFYPGDTAFVKTADDRNCWRMGYSKKSIIPDNLSEKGYSLGGYFNLPQVKAISVADGQFVRAVCIDDNSSRGKVLYAVIDGAGISSVDVRQIRSRLADFAKENNIKSINISATHAHSCIDTQGLSANLIKAVFLNPVIAALGLKIEPETGRDSEFMALLYDQTVAAAKEACKSMTAGKLYIGETDISDYIKDKRSPVVYDTQLHRIRFVPDNGAKEIWIANMGAHPTSLDRTSTEVSSDYPFYIEKYVNEHENADMMFIQGAQAAITTEKTLSSDDTKTRYENMAAYGERLGSMLCSIDEETEIEPYLNIRSDEIFIPASNGILILAGKAQLVNNKIVKTGKGSMDVSVRTEVGYMELGSSVAIALMPGELMPEIAFGGAYTAEESWTGKDWAYKPLTQIAGRENLLVFGLCNDAIGYIMPDNDYGCILADEHYEEEVSIGKASASSIVSAFTEIIQSVR